MQKNSRCFVSWLSYLSIAHLCASVPYRLVGVKIVWKHEMTSIRWYHLSRHITSIKQTLCCACTFSLRLNCWDDIRWCVLFSLRQWWVFWTASKWLVLARGLLCLAWFWLQWSSADDGGLNLKGWLSWWCWKQRNPFFAFRFTAESWQHLSSAVSITGEKENFSSILLLSVTSLVNFASRFPHAADSALQ